MDSHGYWGGMKSNQSKGLSLPQKDTRWDNTWSEHTCMTYGIKRCHSETQQRPPGTCCPHQNDHGLMWDYKWCTPWTWTLYLHCMSILEWSKITWQMMAKSFKTPSNELIDIAVNQFAIQWASKQKTIMDWCEIINDAHHEHELCIHIVWAYWNEARLLDKWWQSPSRPHQMNWLTLQLINLLSNESANKSPTTPNW